MDQEIKKLAKMVKFCRKNGIKSIKTGEITVELFPPIEKSSQKGLGADLDFTAKPKSKQDYLKEEIAAEEEMLYWSTPYYDELKQDEAKD